jgi:septum formation protein
VTKLILASQSPRRKDLLCQIGLNPDKIVIADIDETPQKKELPIAYAKRIALSKAQKIYKQYKNNFILAADTVVFTGRTILLKASNDSEVEACLKKLSGRSHQVITAICLVTKENKFILKTSTSRVKFKRLASEEISQYLLSQEGIGKAGGYAIQGLAAKFVISINGSYSNIVGLDLNTTYNLLKGNGFYV